MGRKFTTQKHEISVRADMEIAAHSEYTKNYILHGLQNTLHDKNLLLLYVFQGTIFHCSFLLFQGYQLHLLMNGIFLNSKIHGIYAHGFSSYYISER